MKAAAQAAPVDVTPSRARRAQPGVTKPHAEPQATPVAQDTTTPKKRGRPAKIHAENVLVENAHVENALPKSRGRPRKQENIDTPAVPTKTAAKRVGRPVRAPTELQLEELAQVIPRRRGRPPKASSGAGEGVVAGPSRVTKRVGRVPKAVVTPRIDPRIRSKLRTRIPKKEIKEKEPTQVAASAAPKRRGRPPKNAPPAPVPVSKKNKKTARDAVNKPVVRRRRGFVTLDVPKKFAAQMQQYLLNLQAEADAEAATEADVAAAFADGVAQVDGTNDGNTGPFADLEPELDAEEGAQEDLARALDEVPSEDQYMDDSEDAEQEEMEQQSEEELEEKLERVVGEEVVFREEVNILEGLNVPPSNLDDESLTSMSEVLTEENLVSDGLISQQSAIRYTLAV